MKYSYVLNGVILATDRKKCDLWSHSDDKKRREIVMLCKNNSVHIIIF